MAASSTEDLLGLLSLNLLASTVLDNDPHDDAAPSSSGHAHAAQAARQWISKLHYSRAQKLTSA